MFVRTKQQTNGKVSILIVENVRESGKVRQKTLRQVATVLEDEVERFMEVAEHIKSVMKVECEQNLFPALTLAELVIFSRKRSIGDESPLAVNLRTMREESRIVTGFHEIYGSLYDETFRCHSKPSVYSIFFPL